MPFECPPTSLALDAKLALLVASYQQLLGRPLVELARHDPETLRRALWEAPCVIVAHGVEPDPVFFYGNRLALQLFEFEFDDFSRLPSRYSAEPLARDARDRLLARVSQQGYVDDYSGVRISRRGRRFLISRATVWNLVDAVSGSLYGQAATFSAWQDILD